MKSPNSSVHPMKEHISTMAFVSLVADKRSLPQLKFQAFKQLFLLLNKIVEFPAQQV